MRKAIILSSILVGVILLAGCGKQQAQNQSSQSQNSVPQPKQESIIYKNDVIGFELEYPNSDWEVSEKYDGYKDNEQATTIQHLAGPKNFVDMTIVVEKRFKPAEEELVSFFNPSQKGGVDLSKQKPENTIIDGHKGYKVVSGGEGTPADTIYLEIDKKSSFNITTSFSAGSSADPQIDPYVCEEKECMDSLKSILSTFKFSK